MFNRLKNTIRNFLAPQSYGLMVVNCSYFRPMAGKRDYRSSHYLSDDKYLELCELIREAE